MSTTKSRYKKLARLAKSSSAMINEFGFGLFLKTAISELQKNKMRVFDPIIDHKEPEISDETAYLQWQAAHAVTPSTKSSNKSELSQFQFKPRLHICVITDDKNKSFLHDTLNSLGDQTCDLFNFSIREITFQTSLEEIDSKRFDALPGINEKHVKFDDGVRDGSGFTVFLQSGSILVPDALYQIIKFLNKNPDSDVVYSDEDYITEARQRVKPFFKPCWSPNLFLSMDYISNFFVVRNSLLNLDKVSEKYGSAQFYDLILRLWEKSCKIYHIPTILVSIRLWHGFQDRQDFAENVLKSIADHFVRRKINAAVSRNNLDTGSPTSRIKYPLDSDAKVSIIIPTKDNKVLLERCISAIKSKTSYKNYEIIIIDNNSTKQETLSYFKSLPYQVIRYEEPFNFSTMNNLAVSKSTGKYVLFMNDDVAPLESHWLDEMLSICQQEGVGAVGAKLVQVDKTIQHAGIAILPSGAGFHPFQNLNHSKPGYFGLVNVIRNCSAVTGACLLMSRKIFDEIGMFDETFDLYYGDTDLCLKAIKHGYRILYTPYALLLHQGSSTIKENSSAFFAVENHRQFITKWPELQDGDPFYNPNLGWDYKINVKNL